MRCYFCGGGLSSWESDDDPWVEHAHWFPECLYLSQCKGQDFIRCVREMVRAQELESNELREQECLPARTERDTFFESRAECNCHDEVYIRTTTQQAIAQSHNTPAAIAGTPVSEAFNMEKHQTQSENNKDVTSKCSNESLEKSSTDENCASSDCRGSELETLQKENKALKDMTTCKICMDKEINIVFLPCGHMAACSECSPAMRVCPMCRAKVKGAVRAYF